VGSWYPVIPVDLVPTAAGGDSNKFFSTIVVVSRTSAT